MLSELSESHCSLLLSGSDGVLLDVMKEIRPLLLVKGHFLEHFDGVWFSNFGLYLLHVDSLQSLIR